MADEQLSLFDARLASLNRMILWAKERGWETEPWIERREIWLSGEAKIVNVLPELIASVARNIPSINKNGKGERITRKKKLEDPKIISDRIMNEVHSGGGVMNAKRDQELLDIEFDTELEAEQFHVWLLRDGYNHFLEAMEGKEHEDNVPA